MPRVVYIHWHAVEAEARAAELRRAGLDAACFSAQGQNAHHALLDPLPGAFLIDLRRLPSHGRELGGWLRQRKATRSVPLVFICGAADKTQRVRELLPDAEYTTWAGAPAVLRRVLERAPGEPSAAPVVPDGMAGYAGTPLWKKLGLKVDASVKLLDAPQGFAELLAGLPAGVRLSDNARGAALIVLLFAADRAALDRRWAAASRAVADGGRLWLCWPKRASGLGSDLGEPAVRAFGLEHGWVDYKIAAIDATWSGLCFARRKA